MGVEDGGRRLVAKQESASHTIETWEWTSPALGCLKRVSVLVPMTGMTRPDRFPALFLLHGFGGSRSTWLLRTRLVELLRGLDLIVVLPESGRRWFINDHRGLGYEDYLVRELVPFTEECFPVCRRPGHRAIGGFSMGGAAALMQALRHPGLFDTVVSHAGAFEGPMRVGDPYSALRSQPDLLIPSTEAHERVWGPPGSAVRARYNVDTLIASGTDEHRRLSVYADVGLGDYERIITMNRTTARSLRAAGIRTEYHERPGTHDLEFLDRALPHSLRFAAERLGAACRRRIN